MDQRPFLTAFFFLLFALMSGAVKIGISNPIPENVTTEAFETTTSEPTKTSTTTTTSPTTSKTTIKISTAKPIKTIITPPSTPSTTSTTSPVPSTSTTVAPNPIKYETRTNLIRNQNVDYAGYFCVCDLKHHHCDINCCCDIDCIPEELKSFDCHREESQLEDVHYQQGLPPCKINEGWLCVFRNNFDDVKHKQPIYVMDFNNIYDWPQLLLETNYLTSDQTFYKIGEPILLFHLEVNEVIEYDIPFSLIDQHCEIFESIHHLAPQNISCQTSLEKAQNLEAILFRKLYSSFLLQRPSIRIPMDGIIKDTQIEFISINLFRCTKEFGCIPASTSNYTFDIFEDLDYSSQIQTKIYHNITNLIKCDVFFVRSQSKFDKVWQNYEVKFIYTNETDEGGSTVSGPLGYNTGSPLIIAHKVFLNKTADHINSNLILNYFHPNRKEVVHIYAPRRRANNCEASQSTVNFGESVLVQCSVQLENLTELNSEANFTRICGDLQTRSLQFLQGSDILKLQEDYYISIFGYPTNKTDAWTKIEVRHYEHLPIVGAYMDKEYAFICQNMILSLKFEFLTVKDDVQGVPHQNLLKRATVEVGKRHDLQFELDEIISIPITFSSVFQDLRELSGAVRGGLCQKSVFISASVLIYEYFFYK